MKGGLGLAARDILGAQCDRNWLVGLDSAQFWRRWRRRCRNLETLLTSEGEVSILLVTADPLEALAGFFAACCYPVHLWLGNPTWGQREWRQVLGQIGPAEFWGTVPAGIRLPSLSSGTNALGSGDALLPSPATTQIWIPTGGSSGDLRFACHDWTTLTASVAGFCQHFQAICPRTAVTAYCVLPLYHVSGLMQALRCLVTGGQLWVQSFKELQQGEPLPGRADFLSLVPTQLQRLLTPGSERVVPQSRSMGTGGTAAGRAVLSSDQGSGMEPMGIDPERLAWLRGFTAILLGGGPPWPELLARSRVARLPLAPTYGMTETASQVATLLPSAFLAGNSSSGQALPHSHITIQSPEGEPLPPNTSGLITISAESLAGRYRHSAMAPLGRSLTIAVPFQPGDRGYLDAAGYLYVLGRQGNLIISGGEKVQPEEVEAALLATGQVVDVGVVGVPDGDWGSAIAVLWVPRNAAAAADPTLLKAALKGQLSPYKIPKHWLTCPELPRNAQGKLNRRVLQQQAMEILSTP
ncbi:AMP-binding protein [Leptolyngbya sp. PCC 6406]|uniref:AMP-binding protein n=1 Tax=Leptolyngbya sp. PCC 6406 TaxID=1173264 RepID=UPI0002DC3851|nr:AMP-binding protein [Leptolyngbya sp. PCC 6406]